MAKYPDVNMLKFRQELKKVNPSIDSGLTNKTFGKSSLQPLMAILNNVGGNATEVYKAIAALPTIKADRYKVGLKYLLKTYPGLNDFGIKFEDLRLSSTKETKAALYTQTPLPGNFNPENGKGQGQFVKPTSSLLNMSIVNYILSNPGTTGILLIHLGESNSVGMDQQFSGRTTLQHIQSVTRVARVMGCPICVLSMAKSGQEHLCETLQAEYNQFANNKRRVVHEPKYHTATNQQEMLNFLASRSEIVVMGFDATICVFANVFGSAEPMSLANAQYRPPLITFANLLMSRATLVTKGPLNCKTASLGADEYGPLFMLG
ncbi:MAG: hypothetical protein V4732_15025 [Pseudomonadota bacterium]